MNLPILWPRKFNAHSTYFSATSTDDKITRLFIGGGVSKTAGIGEVFEQRLSVPVEVLDPFRRIEVDEDL
ncbi:MAG: pilus assembly protein PilM [Syntrophotaleaceae bacterium]